MQRKKSIVTILLLILATLLQITQIVSSISFDDMLQQLQNEGFLGVNANLPASDNVDFDLHTLHTVGDRFKAYSVIQPGKKSYVIFGDNFNEHPEETNAKLDYSVTFKDPHELDTPLPKFTNCVFYAKQGKNIISRDFQPNDSSFTYTPEGPKNMNINHGVHLIQCEFIAPSQGNALLWVRANYIGTATDIFFPQNFWTKEEEASKTPLDPSKKTAFSDNIIITYDDYNNSKAKDDVELSHSIEIVNLKHDYSYHSDKKEFYIRLTGVNFSYREIPNKDMRCTIKEIIDGKEDVHIRPVSIVDIKPHLGGSNPHFKIHTGDEFRNHKFTAGSTLKIQCPSIFLFKSHVANGPNQHIVTSARGDTYFEENYTLSVSCRTFPCSLFLTQNERQKDIIDGEDMRKYLIIGGIFGAVVIIGVALGIYCKKRKQSGEYSNVEQVARLINSTY